MSGLFTKLRLASAGSSRGTVLVLLCAVVMMWGLPGCEEPKLEFREVKRLDERMTESDLNRFLYVINALPDKKLPEFPSSFGAPPNWEPNRTLPVSELVKLEEEKLRRERTTEWLARRLERNRHLQRVLSKVKLSTEQFVGFAMTIGVTLAKTTLDEKEDLDAVLKTNAVIVNQLYNDHRLFSSLSEDGQFYILKQAMALNRIDRASQLEMVPPENVALVNRHREKLLRIFPEPYRSNPLDCVADLLEEQGVPFEELPGEPTDEVISWSREKAIIGYDQPTHEAVSVSQSHYGTKRQAEEQTESVDRQSAIEQN